MTRRARAKDSETARQMPEFEGEELSLAIAGDDDAANLPVLAIVGRPNVGKSTLFNRLVGSRHAIVDDTPGVTRDVRESPAQLGDLRFTLLDTAGWETSDIPRIEGHMRRFTERAID